MSTKQKLNTRGSTEAELIRVHDVLLQVLWTRYFLESQSFKVNGSVLHQDNLSDMMLATNDRASSSKHTRHINIRYFFVADRIKSKEVSLEHEPTDTMVGDFFTKPLQGNKFLTFRKQILGM